MFFVASKQFKLFLDYFQKISFLSKISLDFFHSFRFIKVQQHLKKAYKFLSCNFNSYCTLIYIYCSLKEFSPYVTSVVFKYSFLSVCIFSTPISLLYLYGSFSFFSSFVPLSAKNFEVFSVKCCKHLCVISVSGGTTSFATSAVVCR